MYLHLPVAEIAIFIPEFFCFSFLVGVISGLTGMGGGIIITPLMISLGVSAPVAIGTAQCHIFSSSYSAFIKYDKKNIDYHLAAYIIFNGILGMIAGIYILGLLSQYEYFEFYLRILFTALLTFMAIFTIFTKDNIALSRSDATSGDILKYKKYFSKTDLHINVYLLSIFIFIIGVFSGVLGVGGGFLIVPLLIYGFNLKAPQVLPLCQFHLMILSAAGIFLHSIWNANIDAFLAMILVVGSSIGAALGVSGSKKISTRNMRFLFIGILILMSIYMVYEIL